MWAQISFMKGLSGQTLQQIQELRDTVDYAMGDDMFTDSSYADLQSVAAAMKMDGVPDDGETMVHALREYFVRLYELF